MKAVARDQVIEHISGDPSFADSLAAHLWQPLHASAFFVSALEILPRSGGLCVLAYASRNFPSLVEAVEKELSAPLGTFVQPGPLRL